MNQSKETTEKQIEQIDGYIERLTQVKYILIKKLAVANSQPSKGDWFILDGENKYYQYLSITNGEVALVRNEDVHRLSLGNFKVNFTKATPDDVHRHISYLTSKKRSYIKVDAEPQEHGYPQSFDFNHLTELAKKLNIQSTDYKMDILDMFKQRGVGRSSITEVIEAAKARQGFNPNKCEFYMNTVGEYNPHGGVGTKVRHDSYEKAETEAIRLCELNKEEVFIVGVVASVKPVKEEKVKIVIKPTVFKR